MKELHGSAYIHMTRAQRAIFFHTPFLIIHNNEIHIYNENYVVYIGIYKDRL